MRFTVPRQPRSPFQDGGVQSWNGQSRIIELNNVNKAFLGVSTEKSEKGALIMQVTKGSAAEKAGLKNGDIITKINDIKIENPDGLTKAIGKFKPEEKVKVGYLREGKAAEVSASLGKRAATYTINSREPFVLPFNEENFEFDGFGNNDIHFNWNGGQPKLGIKAQDTDDGKGVKVLEVDEESAAEKAGIKEGDIITSFDGKAINSVNELLDGNSLAREAKKISIPIEYLRNGQVQKVELKMPRKLRTAEL
nr:PDZ domain-containing protein [Flavihumibacter sp. UBA7668]